MPRNPDDYTVGYRKPPMHTRFQKGKSGNLPGRKKGAKSLAKHIQEELARKVIINENGRRKSITKAQAIGKQLVNKAVSGDTKVIPLIMNEDRMHQAEAAGGSGDHVSWTTEEDMKVIQAALERFGAGDADADGGESQ